MVLRADQRSVLLASKANRHLFQSHRAGERVRTAGGATEVGGREGGTRG
jgi:hypothetical protein